MRRSFSILFIALILFNVLGYYGVFLGLRFKTTQDLIHRLDADDYLIKETFTLKIPMAIPYTSEEHDFKRANGEIEYQGEYYRLVKQKLSKDTLFLVCLKDNSSKHIKQALQDYVKTFADKPTDSQQNAKTLPGFIKDYLLTEIVMVNDTEGWYNSIPYHWTESLISDPYSSSPYQPPKA